MPFVTKDWRDSPGDLTTPITAAALENLETRTTAGIPYENVAWHGAVGNGTGDQTAAIQAAIDAQAAAGGTVFIPRGTYRMLGSLSLPNGVSLLGEGETASKLVWPTSLGAGTWGLAPGPGGGRHHGTISSLFFEGPGSGATPYGTVMSDMNGVTITQRQHMENCVIQLFHRGLGVLEDHLSVQDCAITTNTYNLAYLTGGGGAGDHRFTSVDLAGATIASVYVESDQGVAGASFNTTHLGFAPYGFLSATGKAGGGFITNSVFIRTAIEFYGTAAIWGANTTDQIYGTEWIGCYADHHPTYLLPATTHEFMVRAGEIKTSVFDMKTLGLVEPGTAYFSTSGNTNQHLFSRYEMVPRAQLQYATAANFLHRTSGGPPSFCTFTDEAGASGVFCRADQGVTKGQLVKLWSGDNTCRTYDDNTLADAPLGVALQSGAAGEIVAVATAGFIQDLLVADGTITGERRFLKPAATDGRVVQATGWSDGPIVGVSVGSASAGGAFSAHLRCGAWT